MWLSERPAGEPAGTVAKVREKGVMRAAESAGKGKGKAR